jgi:MFS family permease
MSLAKIIWGVSALAAVILAFVNLGGHDAMILAILGLLSGFFLDHDHRRGVIIAAIFLMMGGAGSLGSIPGIGEHLTAILTSLGAVFGAASVMAILKTLVERLLKSNKASATS